VFAPGTDENALMEAAIDAGAEDVVTHDDGSAEVITAPHDFIAVKDALAARGLAPAFAEVTMKPLSEVEMHGEDAQRMQKLLDALEAIDDVQDVHTSAVLDEG
jgi:transcriptional/translational regulatory protein YebC/TACO1